MKREKDRSISIQSIHIIIAKILYEFNNLTICHNISNIMSSKKYLFIDGSYFIFHRYFSLVRWWKISNPEDDMVSSGFTENTLFVDKYKKTFIDTLTSLPKKLNILGAKIIVGKDCKRENIWRKQYYKEYKETRQKNTDIAYFMKLAYDELFLSASVSIILNHSSLEADDCIALYVKHLLSPCQSQSQKERNKEIYIITSDKDYLQLTTTKNIHLVDLGFKDLTKQKSSYGCSAKDLFCKIVMGDTSDNIPSIFLKCGPKTAEKCYDDPSFFQERLKREKADERWKLNQLLIDFNYIPKEIRNEFIQYYFIDSDKRLDRIDSNGAETFFSSFITRGASASAPAPASAAP